MSTPESHAHQVHTHKIRAAIAREPRAPLELEEGRIEHPRPDEVLVRVVATGVCHTDIGVRNQDFSAPLPMVLGHEGAGIVEAVGYAVTEVVPGDHVVMTYMWCGHCHTCESGHPAHCENMGALNFGGGRFKAGASFAAFGAGAVGLAAVMAARVAGATTIIAVDVTPGRLELAKTLGATHVINSRETDPVAAIREITGGGADYTLECSGRTAVLRQAIDALGTLGACGIVGATKEGTEVAFNVNDVTISTSGMTVYDEETFGPVTTVVRVNGVEEAVRVANDTVYGLSAAVFGRDVTRALAVASRIESGSVHINGATVQNEPQASYGGMKQSGYGRFDGRAVIDQFTEVKWVTIEPSNQPCPF